MPTALWREYTDELTENAESILAIKGENRKRGPNPEVRSEDAQGVIAEIQAQAPTPAWLEIVFSAVEKGDDYTELAEAYDQQLNTVVSDAIAAAGLDENVFTFPDWDPLDDYVTEPGA